MLSTLSHSNICCVSKSRLPSIKLREAAIQFIVAKNHNLKVVVVINLWKKDNIWMISLVILDWVNHNFWVQWYSLYNWDQSYHTIVLHWYVFNKKIDVITYPNIKDFIWHKVLAAWSHGLRFWPRGRRCSNFSDPNRLFATERKTFDASTRY